MGVVITAAELRRLRELPKDLPDGWIDTFLGKMKVNGPQLQVNEAIAKVTTGPTRGVFSVYLRESITQPALSFSAGLLFRPIGQEQELMLVRVNGPHSHSHEVDEGGMYFVFAGVPHIHYCTEAGLRRTQHKDDQQAASSFALPVAEYGDLRGAAKSLARRVGIPIQRSFDEVQT